MCSPMRAHWRHLANTTELVLPSVHPSPQTKRQIDWSSCLCTAHSKKLLNFTMAAHVPQNSPFPWVDLDPHLTHSLAHPSPQPKQHLDQFSHICTDDCRVSLYFTMGRPFLPSKLPLPMGRSGPPSNTWFPGPTRVLNPNGISIGSAVFAGPRLTSAAPTNRPRYSVSNNSTAMRPNNGSRFLQAQCPCLWLLSLFNVWFQFSF